eukprot:5982714-Pyramimonas_sp.AAC.1
MLPLSVHGCRVGRVWQDARWRRGVYSAKRYVELMRSGDVMVDTGPLQIPGFSWIYLRPGLMHAGCLG